MPDTLEAIAAPTIAPAATAMPAGAEPASAAPAVTSATTLDWPDIDRSLLQDGRPSLPDFPLRSLPSFWRAWVSETAHGAGAPVDYIVQALLASVAGVCGASIVARITETWSEPMILWQALVGGPSHGKTPALDALRRPLAAVAKTMGREKRGPTVIDQDTPLPQLLGVARKAPAGALLWRDEPAAWLRALACNGRGQPRQLSALLDTWSPLKTALGPGSPALSILGCLDPARLDLALAGSDDGRAARFLYAWPGPAPWRSFLDAAPSRESELVNALQRIASITRDPAAPLMLPFDGPAQNHLDRHLEDLHRELAACEGVEAAWLGKGRGTVVRLALALALLDWAATASATAPQPVAITGEKLAGACALWTYFRSHARAVLVRSFRSTGERQMRQALTWIRARGAPQISREDVRRHALGQTPNAHEALQVILSLQRAGFLRQAADPYRGMGRPALRWDVNPVLIDVSLAESAESVLPSEVACPERSRREGPTHATAGK